MIGIGNFCTRVGTAMIWSPCASLRLAQKVYHFDATSAAEVFLAGGFERGPKTLSEHKYCPAECGSIFRHQPAQLSSSCHDSMFRNAFKPGERVPEKAPYWVHHYQHRMPHICAVHAFETFPECNQCGARVRFEPVSKDTPRKTMRLADDVDFRQAAAQRAR